MATAHSEALGKLLLVQCTLHVMEDEEHLAHFVGAGIRKLPGVNDVGLCIRGRYLGPGLSTGQDTENPCALCRNVWTDHTRTSPSSCRRFSGRRDNRITSLKLSTAFRALGFLHLELSDPEVFEPYRPHIQNTANLIALVLENRVQEKSLRAYQSELEKMVADRTRQLEESVTRYRTLFERSNDPVFLHTLDGRIIDANRAAVEMLGYPHDTLTTMRVRELHPQGARTVSDEVLEALGRQGSIRYESVFCTASSDVLDIEISASVIDRSIGLVLGICRDVSARKRANEAIRASEERYRTLFETMARGVVYFDGTGSVTSANPAATRILGVDPEEICARQLDDLLGQPVDEEGNELLEAGNPLRVAIEGGKEIDGVVVGILRPQEDARRWLRIKASPRFRDGESRPFQVQAILDDITEQRRTAELEEQLRQSRKMEALGNLAGGIAHDFNNLLQVILGHSELLQLDLTPEHASHGSIALIVGAATRAAELTQQLLGFARKGKMQHRPVDLHEIIHETVNLLRRTIDRRIIIDLQLAAADSIVVGDPSQLQQVVLNLAVNARDAMANGGRLRLATRISEVAAGEGIVIDTLSAGRYLEIVVADTGSGIPAEIQSRIFEPFFTTKPRGEGTGLGLATVYGIVRNHGGDVELTSTPGSGSEFRVLLPLSDESAASDPKPKATTQQQGGRGVVLVVEDEPTVAMVARSMLERLGYEVVVRGDGLQALEHYREHAEEIDLVIVDMTMPVMDGAECFHELQRIDPQVKAILATGHAADEVAQEVLAGGMRGLIQKPYRLGTLSRVVASVLAGDTSS